MSSCWWILLAIAICSAEEYDDWVPWDFQDNESSYVMWESAKLNRKFRDVIEKYSTGRKHGIHVTIYPPPKPPVQAQAQAQAAQDGDEEKEERPYRQGKPYVNDPGCDIHASYNQSKNKKKKKSEAHWGIQLRKWAPKGKENVWKTEELKPLKVAYDAFAKYKTELFLTPQQCSPNNNNNQVNPLYTLQWTKAQRVQGFRARRKRENLYPEQEDTRTSISSASSYPSSTNYSMLSFLMEVVIFAVIFCIAAVACLFCYGMVAFVAGAVAYRIFKSKPCRHEKYTDHDEEIERV